MKKLVYRLEAVVDIDDAYTWYAKQRSGLGDQLLLALLEAERAILANPATYPIVRRDTRRYLLRRFPYQLLYRVLEDEIVIVACFHARRSPRSMATRK